ncbi:hypothetical protein [Myroides fluvii]|uniref:hypothetical protein n=1 Tax=Myroides fluvii TaxID=2572594 RepID=UPI00131B0120|nr:hypothetical protein [Myroides fluvii]
MKYNFSIHKSLTDSVWFYVNIEDSEYDVLGNLSNVYWTPQIIQQLIDGVLSTKDSDKEYKYQTEGDDLYIYSNDYGVQFFALKMKKKTANLVLSHDEFVGFLQDFKTFVERNS